MLDVAVKLPIVCKYRQLPHNKVSADRYRLFGHELGSIIDLEASENTLGYYPEFKKIVRNLCGGDSRCQYHA